MKNQPLSAAEHLKVAIFLPLLLPAVFPYLLGIIPTLFLVFGFIMMKKNSDFSSLEVSVKAAKIYYKVVIVISFLVAVFGLVSYLQFDHNDDYNVGVDSDRFLTFLVASLIAIISFAYTVALNYLFYIPLQNHSEWVAFNGVFSNSTKRKTQSKLARGIDILQTHKSKHLSVADELAKWAKLKEDGHISSDEFDEARSKLLKRA